MVYPQNCLTMMNYCFTLIYASKKRIAMTDTIYRTKRLSRILQHAVMGLGVIVGAVTLWASVFAVLDPNFLPQALKTKFGAFAPLSVSGVQVLLFVVFIALQTLPLLLALISLWRAFGEIAKSGGVDQATALHVRSAGIRFGLTAVMLFLATPLLSLIASIGALPGHRFVSVGLETQHLLAMLLSAVLVMLGHVLSLAADISDDNRQIV
jgi:hypothetical protein